MQGDKILISLKMICCYKLFDKKAKIGMDEEMIFLDNIMPVEIALKREIEYRRKVEAWRKQQQIDPKIDTLQLEVRFMKNGILILFCL